MSIPEPIEVPEEVQDRFAHTVAVAIVVATLAGALVGYLESLASRGSSLAALEAQRSLVQAMGGLVRADQAAQVDYHNFAVTELLRRRAADVDQLPLVRPSESRLRRLERARLEELAERGQALTAISPAGDTGPEVDPIFPFRFFSDTEHEADRLWALADAASEEDNAWGQRETNYIAVLTIFAVAVYLLGLSISIELRVQRLLAAVGLILIVVGTIWAVWLATHRPIRAPAEAADAFADGRQQMLLATESDDYRRADRLFSRAIELRPGFAQAFVERAAARFFAGSPRGAHFESLTTPEAVRASVSDLRTALELGLETRAVVGELGFETFLLGLPGDEALLAESIAFTERAIALDPTDPVLHFNHAVAKFAAGDVAGAREAYRVGTLYVIYEDPGELVGQGDTEGSVGAMRGLGALEPQGNAFLQQQWLSGALTDLELLVKHRPGLAARATEFKEYLVGSVARGEPGTGDAAEPATTAGVDLFPAEVQWWAQLPGYDPDADILSQQWYVQTPLGWAGMPEVSGVREPGDDENEWFRLESFVTASFPPRCLTDGRYRVELYVNGHQVATAQNGESFGLPEASVLRDVGVAVCNPSDWKPVEEPVAGFLAGVEAPDRSAGSYVLRFQHPDLLVGREPTTEETALFMDLAIDNISSLVSSLFPETPVFHEELDDAYFLGLEAPSQRYYRYEGGWVLGGAGVANDGAVLVGLSFGPRDDFNSGGQGRRIFDSLTEYAPLL